MGDYSHRILSLLAVSRIRSVHSTVTYYSAAVGGRGGDSTGYKMMCDRGWKVNKKCSSISLLYNNNNIND